MPYFDFSYEHLIGSVEGSLRALQTDYIDILLLHRPDALVEPDEVADSTLARLVAKVYHGSRELLMNRLLADEDISADELRRIKKLLQKRLDEASP